MCEEIDGGDKASDQESRGKSSRATSSHLYSNKSKKLIFYFLHIENTFQKYDGLMTNKIISV